MTTILFVAAALPPAKVAEADHALRMCVQLADRGHEVHVLTVDRHGLPAGGDLPASLTLHPLMQTWSWRELPIFVRLVRAVRPDVMLLFFLGTLFGYRTMVLMLPVISRLLQPGSTAITMFSNVGAGAPKDGSLRSWLRRAVFRLLGPLRLGGLLIASHHIVLLSEVYRERLRGFYLSRIPISRSVIIPPPPLMRMADDPEAARTRGRGRLGVDRSDTVVAFFGRLYPGKGLEALVTAVADVHRTRPDVRLALIGGYLDAELFWTTRGTYGEELDAHIARECPEGLVLQTGEYDWDSEEGSEYLYAADLVVLPLAPGVHLYNSSFAAVCAHRRPVVITTGDVAEPSLEHRRNVYMLTDARADTIAAAIREVLDDGALRRELAAGAAELAGRYFDWDTCVRRMEELFRART